MNTHEARGLIILLPVLALVLSFAVQNEVIALTLAAICMMAALAVLYRHLDELTDISGGNLAPKLPFSRHTGLRLPWTAADEDTWIVAHRILG